MSDRPETESESTCDLPDLCGLVRSRVWMIAGMAFAFLVLAVIVTAVKGPTFEATAYLEVDDLGEIPTIEAKLKFLSLYCELTENNLDEARDLARRTRIKNPRGSRIIGVTVRHAEPEWAETEANAIAEGFTTPGQKSPDDEAESIGGNSGEADSLATLEKTWESVTAEFEKLSQRYQNDADHPAVVGARERRDAVAKRIREQVDVAAIKDNSGDLGAQLKALIQGAQAAGRKKSQAGSGVRFVEPAIIPQVPAGPSRLLILAGAALLGAFSGVVLALCGCCEARKK